MNKFFENKQEKITEKALSQSLFISIFSILICIVVLCSMTYAWFNEGFSSGGNVLESSRFDLDIKVLNADGEELPVEKNEDGVYTCTLGAAGSEYTVSMQMTADTTASKGYCDVILGDCDKLQTTSISNDAQIGVEELVFFVDALSNKVTISFIPKWGLPANAMIVSNSVFPAISASPDEEDESIKNEALLKEILSGKSLSILGDSISTFAGYSNNTSYNSTIENNAVYYGGTNYITDVNETWWMQAINRTGMVLNVNNSWSGDKVTEKGVARALELDNNSDTPPDVIAVYLGINDSRTGVALETFSSAYAEMVMGMKEKYPDAEIYLFSLVYTSRVNSGVNPDDIVNYNKAIEQIAGENDCGFVDLFHNSGIDKNTFADYMADGTLHPNYEGMDRITQCFVDILVETLVNKD